MKRITSVLTTCGAVTACGAMALPIVVAGIDLIEAVRPAGATLELQVTGVAGVPSDAEAVVLNLTSADARGTGFLTAFPCGEARPNASNLNYGLGAPVANSAIVRVGAGGKVCLFTGDADTELIADINGYFPAGSSYTPTTPSRVLDTRRALSTVDGVGDGEGLRQAGTVYELPVAGRAGVPADAAAVVLNLTSADALGTGFVMAYPCGAQQPNASNLNFHVGAPVANSAIVKVGTGGKVCLLTADADTQLIADVNGYFPTAGYTSMSPSRLLDTRRALSTVDGVGDGEGLRQAGTVYELPVAGRAGVPADAAAVVLNLTSAGALGTGFLTAYPCGEARPNASNLNYGPGAPVANSAIVKVGSGGKVCLFTGDTSTQLIADVNGWFSLSSGYTATTPSRILDTRNEPTAAPPGTAPAPNPVPPGAAFVETFTGNTGMERFRRGVFQRNVDVHDYYGQSGGTWQGDHPIGCSIPGDPYTTRTLQWDPNESMAQRVTTAFYNCNDHMMTSMGDVDGYSLVWFSPNQTFTNIRRVCWDVSLTNLGDRQWWEIAIVPAGEPELFADVSSANLPNQGPGTMTVKFNSINESNKLALDDFDYGGTYNAGTDKATRYPHCLVDNGNGTVTVTQQRSTGLVTFTRSGSLPDGPVTVLFKDHKYTPDKSNRSFDSPAYTWHWDNIIVE